MMFKKFIQINLIWTLVLLLMSSGLHANESLLRFDDSFDMDLIKTNHASVVLKATDDQNVLQLTTGHGKRPGMTLRPAGGVWDVKDAAGLAIELKNSSSQRANIHARVDNPGPWKTSAHNSNRLVLQPGKSGILEIEFDKNYGQQAKQVVDGHNISQVLIFIPNANEGQTIEVKSIKTITSPTASKASKATQTESKVQSLNAYRPGIEGILFDFDEHSDVSLLKTERTEYSIVSGKDGKALKLDIPAGTNYPGIRFKAHKGAWDLTDFGGIRADITNNGDKSIRVSLRLDNKSNKKNPWNTSYVHIKPGMTVELQTYFGKNGMAPGFPLDAKRVVGALIFTTKQRQSASITIDNVCAFGSPAPKATDSIALSGEMELFDDFDTSRIKCHGGKVTLKDSQLYIDFDGTQNWPSMSLLPKGKAWDLSNFNSVQLDMTNTGDTKAVFGLRVDNPGANGKEHCNSENVTLNPGQTQTVTVTFGKSWGKKGFDIDSANVTNIMIVGPKTKASLCVDNLKANAKKYAVLPNWLGKRPPVEGEWIVTLDEDFNESSLNTQIWNTRMRYDGPLKGELQVYSEKNLSIKDGNLEFLCEKKHGHQYDDPTLPTRDYTTAVIQSFDKFTQKYGYFESRFKAPTARGLWPAFWLMPDRGPDAGNIWKRGSTNDDGMEIDIYEYLCEWGPGRYNVAVHWDGYGEKHQSWGTSHLYHLPTEDGYHTFGCLWEPGRLVFYVDGKLMAEFKSERVGSTPMHMILNVQTGRWSTKDIDDSALPDKWLVDYIRVWQSKERM